MSSSHQGSAQQGRKGESSKSGKEPAKSLSEEWAEIKDPNERRRVQNKLAQRRFRDKVREQREESERDAENQRQASRSYTSPEPGDLEQGQELSGLPWGGLNMGHIVQTGRSTTQNSQRSSRENSDSAAGTNTGGSSRVGLRLTDKFARGKPAWRYFPYGHPGWGSK